MYEKQIFLYRKKPYCEVLQSYQRNACKYSTTITFTISIQKYYSAWEYKSVNLWDTKRK